MSENIENIAVSDDFEKRINEVLRRNIQHYNNLINLSRESLLGYRSIDFENASNLDKKVLAQIIFFDCVEEIKVAINYSSEAIINGHYSVGFSLIRRPFRDLIGCIEHLSFDSKTYIDAMINNDLGITDVTGKRKDFIKDEMIKLITQDDGYFPSMRKEHIEMLHKQRYAPDKAKNTFATLFTHSLHLVTINPAYRTPKNRLNMLPNINVTNEKNLMKHIYYFALPYFLIYINNIIYYNMIENFKFNSPFYLQEIKKSHEFIEEYSELIDEIKDM